jgi:septal ring-binding cell division protein DamX
LNTILSAQDMRQLRERVTHNFHLEPLQQTDIGTYLMFRMRAAGYHGPDLFTPAALKLFAKSSQGLTRRLNILADKALLAAFAANVHQVDVAQARAAIKDAKFEEIVPAKPAAAAPRRPMWLGAAAGALAVVAIFGGWHVWSTGNAAPLPAPVPLAQTAPPVSAAPAAPPAEPAATVAPAPPATPLTDPNVSPTLRLDTQTEALPQSKMDALRQNFDRWIAQVDDRHHVIQLLRVTAENRRAMEKLLEEDFSTLDRDALRIYEANAGNQRWIGLVYGDFVAVSDAEAALRRLPAPVGRHQPFIRPAHQLKQ